MRIAKLIRSQASSANNLQLPFLCPAFKLRASRVHIATRIGVVKVRPSGGYQVPDVSARSSCIWANCRFEISDGVGTKEVQGAKGAGADCLRGRAQANDRSALAERTSVRRGLPPSSRACTVRKPTATRELGKARPAQLWITLDLPRPAPSRIGPPVEPPLRQPTRSTSKYSIP